MSKKRTNHKPKRTPTPKFVREESWRYKRVKPNWRRPRGQSDRMRRRIRGWPPLVKGGYGSPSAIRGLHPSGLREVLIRRPEDLKRIDPKTQAARIGHTVGERKKVAIVERAKELNIKLLNPRIRKPTEAAEEFELAEAPPAEAEAKPETGEAGGEEKEKEE